MLGVVPLSSADMADVLSPLLARLRRLKLMVRLRLPLGARGLSDLEMSSAVSSQLDSIFESACSFLLELDRRRLAGARSVESTILPPAPLPITLRLYS